MKVSMCLRWHLPANGIIAKRDEDFDGLWIVERDCWKKWEVNVYKALVDFKRERGRLPESQSELFAYAFGCVRELRDVEEVYVEYIYPMSINEIWDDALDDYVAWLLTDEQRRESKRMFDELEHRLKMERKRELWLWGA